MSKEEVVKDQFVPGHFECAKCSFYLVSNTIYMGSGTIGANNEPQQCSNGCGPMWRVTWKEHAIKLARSQEAMVDRLIGAQDRIAELEKELATRSVFPRTGEPLPTNYSRLEICPDVPPSALDSPKPS